MSTKVKPSRTTGIRERVRRTRLSPKTQAPEGDYDEATAVWCLRMFAANGVGIDELVRMSGHTPLEIGEILGGNWGQP